MLQYLINDVNYEFNNLDSVKYFVDRFVSLKIYLQIGIGFIIFDL
jgi:hypothetical protein